MRKSIIIFLILSCTAFAISSEIKITHYEINITIPEDFNAIHVKSKLKISNISEPNQLRMDLCKDFLGVSYTDLQVFSNNKKLDFDTDSHKIIIQNIPVANNDIYIDLHYKLVKNKHYPESQYSGFAFEVSDSLIHINAAITRTDNWFPKLEGTHSHRLPEFSLSFDVPNEMQVMASGKLKNEKILETRKISTWKNYPDITDRGLFFFITKYNRIIKKYPDGFTLYMFVPDDTIKGNTTYLADVIHKSYVYHGENFGYPVEKEYKASAFIHGYSGLFNAMNMPVELFTRPISNNDLLFPIRIVIHETSHTWWGNMVSYNSEIDYWLFEGFAKYTEAMAIPFVLNENLELESFKRLKMVVQNLVDYCPSVQKAGETDDRQKQSVSAYYHGALLIKMIESYLGKEVFFSAIKSFIVENKGKTMSAQKFYDHLSTFSGKNFQDLYNDHKDIPGFAKYSVKKLSTKQLGNESIHTFEIENTGEKDLFTNALELSGSDSSITQVYLKKGEKKSIEIVSSSKENADLIIDPDGIFPVMSNDQTPPGGIIYSLNDSIIKFTKVIDGGLLSKAGIKNGMRLLKINNNFPETSNLYELNRILLKPKKTELTLLVEEKNSTKKEIKLIY